MNFSNQFDEGVDADDWPIFPLVGEMSPKATEGGAVPPMSPLGGMIQANLAQERPTLPPSALPGISPTRGEIGCGNVLAITAETTADIAARDALLDRAMGPRWRKKSSEKLRRGRLPSEGLALTARDDSGAVAGTVRLWDIAAGVDGRPALLLGPLAVDPTLKSAGIGSALMRHAIEEAARLGHTAILLVGDAPYYARFGFSAEKTGNLAMPGPFEKHRLLALELVLGALDGAEGVIRPTGRKVKRPKFTAAA